MLAEIAVAAIVPATTIMSLTGVYLWSRDPERRRRAYELLRLMLRR